VELRTVGHSGLRVSRIGLGTLTWGQGTDEHEAAEQIREFLDAGGTLIDTADSYADGAAEALLGGLTGVVVDRDELIICARSGLSWQQGQLRPDPSRGTMLSGLDASLARLGTDYVDLWLAPVWSPQVPVEETLGALESALHSGRARYVGFAGYSGWQVARGATMMRGLTGWPVAAATEYSLMHRSPEREFLPAVDHLRIGTLACAPLGRGVLTAKYRTGTPTDSRLASSAWSDEVEARLGPRARRIVDAVVTAAEGLRCEPMEVALAWVRDRHTVASVLVGARTTDQLRGALMSEELELPAEIRLVLDEISAAP
jgi:aryl-alcohol dehydrogenase-like predicted oxidoreductase